MEVTLNISIDVANALIASIWKNKLVYIHLTTDDSNGHLLDFRRIPVSKFKTSGLKSFEISYSTKDLNQVICCHASADMIASVKTKTSMPIHKYLSESTIKNFINHTEDFEFSDLMMITCLILNQQIKTSPKLLSSAMRQRKMNQKQK